MWKLHAILISTKLSPAQAKSHAEQIAKHTKEEIIKMRKTDNEYRFDVMDKKMFNKFRTKKINDDIELIFGMLKPKSKADDSGTESQSESEHYSSSSESISSSSSESESESEDEEPKKHYIHNYKVITK